MPIVHNASDFKCLLEKDHVNVNFINPYSFLQVRNFLDQNKENIHFAFDSFLSKEILNLFSSIKKIDRLSFDFSSIANSFFQYTKNNGVIVIFVGGRKEEIKSFKKIIGTMYNLQLEVLDGYEFEIRELFIKLEKFKRYFIVFGQGSPLQELNCIRLHELNHLEEIKLSTFTCGGFISQTASKNGSYYPKIINKFGGRFIYRAIRESHVRKRLLYDYPIFLNKIREFLLFFEKKEEK